MTFVTRTLRVPTSRGSLRSVNIDLPVREGPRLVTDSPPPQIESAPAKLKCLILIPAFNESRSVGKLVRRLNRLLPDFDLLVIDDGSTDDTVHQVPPSTTVVSLPFNLGIGGAMQTGYRYASLHGYDIAVQVDGDGQHRPSEVRKTHRGPAFHR